jgi:hypothetical protein
VIAFVSHLVFQTITADNEFSSHLLLGMERVSYLVLRGRIYEHLYLQSHATSATSDLESALVKLYSEILAFLCCSLSYLGKSTVSRTCHAIFHPGTVGQYVSNLDELERCTETSVSNCARLVDKLARNDLKAQLQKLEEILHAPIIRIDSRVGDLLLLAESVERCRILQWVSTIHHETDHYNARKGRLEGTGDWLLARKEYVEWRNSPTSMLLWLHGIRKSTVPLQVH